MKKINPKAYSRALYELTLDKRGAGLEKVIKNFVAHLAKARMLKQSGAIINEFTHYAKAQEGIMEIEIHSGRELPAVILNQVKKTFSATGGSAYGGGKTVEATTSIDLALLGGVVVRTNDRILDGSLRTQLNNLKTKLAS